MKSITSFSKRIFTFGLLAASICGASIAHADALDNIMKSKTIKIAIPTDYPPYGFIGPDMQPRGLDVDMAKLIAEKLGVKIDLIPVVSANRIPYLQTGKADLTISTLGKTPEREKIIDFSAAYAPYYQAVFGPASMNIKNWSDLVGKTVAVVRGGLEDDSLMKAAPSGVDIKRYEDNNATVAAFVSGQTQLVATSSSVAAQMSEHNPQLHAEFKLLLKNSPCFVGIAKGNDSLKAKVNEIIAKAKADGTIDAMSKKWLNSPAGDLPQ